MQVELAFTSGDDGTGDVLICRMKVLCLLCLCDIIGGKKRFTFNRKDFNKP